MVSYRCRSCRWFDHQHSSLMAINEVNYGYCRKHRPSVVVRDSQYYGAWPLVDIEDFCGEFRQDEEV